MPSKISDWERDLRSMDTDQGLRNSLTTMFHGYLESTFADDAQSRQEVLLLFRALKQLFL